MKYNLKQKVSHVYFKRTDFDTFKKDAGTNAYVFSIKKWNDELKGVGILTKSGRYGGGIFAHVDIALEFASWIYPEFKLYIIKDYKRLKMEINGNYDWFINNQVNYDGCKTITYNTQYLPNIIYNNMFNQTPKQYSCQYCKCVNRMSGHFITLVPMREFVFSPYIYIECL